MAGQPHTAPAPVGFRDWVFQDREANGPASKMVVLLAFFRFAQRPPRLLKKPARVAYRFFSDWFLGIELHWEVQVGPGLRIDHGHGLVVHPETVMGSGCRLRHGVTIGNAVPGGGVPVIGNDVDFGVGVVVLGGIHVGDGATLGAGALVIRDVPAGATVVGSPAREVTRAATGS